MLRSGQFQFVLADQMCENGRFPRGRGIDCHLSLSPCLQYMSSATSLVYLVIR